MVAGKAMSQLGQCPGDSSLGEGGEGCRAGIMMEDTSPSPEVETDTEGVREVCSWQNRDPSETGVRKLPDGGPFQYRPCQEVVHPQVLPTIQTEEALRQAELVRGGPIDRETARAAGRWVEQGGQGYGVCICRWRWSMSVSRCGV